jgi:Zn-dependent protease with chaperone function
VHLIMLLAILGVACITRCYWCEATADEVWQTRWQHTLQLFLLPPLLLIVSAIAILVMGPHGTMVWGQEGWLSYLLAIGGANIALLWLLKLTWDGCSILNRVRTYPSVNLNGSEVRLLDLPAPYSAQIGFWQPELVVTQGLIDTLTTEHLSAVLTHERGHHHYRDTFYFFWLGWIRQITGWLPHTEAIWSELLALRELRADRWAADRIDPLLLAEALVLVVQNAPHPDNFCAAFSQVTSAHRLERRIAALLSATVEPPIEVSDRYWWNWLLISLLPLLVIPFHN